MHSHCFLPPSPPPSLKGLKEVELQDSTGVLFGETKTMFLDAHIHTKRKEGLLEKTLFNFAQFSNICSGLQSFLSPYNSTLTEVRI